jgi:N-acetylmuramoyl-L-alanine amidase
MYCILDEQYAYPLTYFPDPKSPKIVAIDPGHGFNCAALGMPPGAVGATDFPASNPPPGQLLEDDLTMAITREIQLLVS